MKILVIIPRLYIAYDIFSIFSLFRCICLGSFNQAPDSKLICCRRGYLALRNAGFVQDGVLSTYKAQLKNQVVITYVKRAGSWFNMDQPGSGNSESDFKTSLAGGNSRNVLQSAGTSAGGKFLKSFNDSSSVRLVRTSTDCTV